MSFFTAPQALAAAGEAVAVARLVEFDFVTAPVRVWDGAHTLTTTDAREWHGLGVLLNIGDLEQIRDGTAPATSFGLSGVDAAVIAAAKASESEAAGRAVTVYGQFLDANGQASGAPWAITTLIMDRISYSLQGPSTRSVSVSAEGLFTRRKRAPYGRMTDVDQKARFPGDKGLEHVATLVDKTVTWPDF